MNRSARPRKSETRTAGPKAPSQRQLRVGEEIRHALAQVIERGEAHDPALQGVMLTVTEVRLSPDLKNATAFFVPLGGAIQSGTPEAATLVGALNHAAAFFRTRVAHMVDLRHAPRISFRFDASFDEANHIDELLHDPRVRRDLDAGSD